MIRTSVSVKCDKKAWDKIVKRMTATTVRGADVGWWGDRYPNGIPVAWVAMLSELGYMTGGLYKGYHPPRPFFKLVFDQVENVSFVSDFVCPRLSLVATGKLSWTAFYKEMGDAFMTKIKKNILDKKSPVNTALTTALKGFNDPLIETGKMYDTIKTRITRSRNAAV